MSLPAQPLASIIIPNWNGAHLLPGCLDSLTRQTYPRFEILVVDNASIDNSRELLAARYPQVRVIPLDMNRGFAGGCNAGFGAAQGEVLVLLNNDTEAEPIWLEELIHALQANPRAGMVASKLRLFSERDKLHSAGDFYRVDGVPGNRGVWQVDAGQYDDPTAAPPLFGVCGGACGYTRELLDEVGVFDEELESYCEDVDLNWRARLAGFECAWAPRAIVYHMVSATGGGARSSYFVGRNFLLVLAKDYPAGLWRKYWPRIVGAQLRITWEALRNWRGEAARARLRGQLAGLIALRRFMSKRRERRLEPKVSEKELDRLLAH